jgi:spore germination cell wall hydrolase CwlJ-like protein
LAQSFSTLSAGVAAAAWTALAAAPALADTAVADKPAAIQLLIGGEAAQASIHPGVIQLLPQPGSAWTDFNTAGDDDLTCLTQAVYYEARSESLQGQEAVAQVVMNRTASGAYASSVCGVVFERNSNNVCQFSFACDGSMDRPLEPGAWEAAHTVAKQALGGFVYKPLRDAMHFHATWVQPAWSWQIPRLQRIGGHIFYR